MKRTIDRLKLIFLGVFVVAAAGIWAYQVYYVQPKERCEAEGSWWSPELRVCRQPVSIRGYDGPKPPPLDSLKETLPRKDRPAAAKAG